MKERFRTTKYNDGFLDGNKWNECVWVQNILHLHAKKTANRFHITNGHVQ